MALAVCGGLDEDGKLGVRIKWPNDLYGEAEGLGGIVAEEKEEEGDTKGADEDDRSPERPKKGRAKLGGILVNASLQNGEWRLVVGCGINILNDLPTTSIAQLMALREQREGRDEARLPSMEDSFAKIMVAFDVLWERFVEEKGFENFLDEYLGRWLHR